VSESAPSLISQNSQSLREVFGVELAKLAAKNSQLVALDGDVAGGTGLHHFRSEFPERFIQVGIAEQNLVGVSAGLARSGFVPFAGTFAAFFLRAVDQIRVSVCYPKSNVKLVASHPGLDVGPDGASAQSLEDLAVFRSLPNLLVVAPGTPSEMAAATRAIAAFDGPAYMRTGRSPVPELSIPAWDFRLGEANQVAEGNDVAIFACGPGIYWAISAANILREEGISARVVSHPTIKPLDEEAILRAAVETKGIVVAEDHSVVGGLGSAVAEFLSENRPTSVLRIGVRDSFGESGENLELWRKYGMTAATVAAACRDLVRNHG